MLILSDGQVLGISSERARYHAARLNLTVTRDTPHQYLYQLVDIVFVDAKDKPVSGQMCYQFSGHTLMDEKWISSLLEVDRNNLFDWLEQPYVRYEIEGVRRRLIYDQLPSAIIFYVYPESLYSHLQKRVACMPATTMSARQWQKTLLNLQHKGIRHEELKWSGILAYLTQTGDDSDEKVSKQTVLENINFSCIRLHMTNELVTVKNGNNKLDYRAKYRYISLFGGEDYREWLVSLPDYQQSHFCSHFTERNILLHIRTKTRFDINGRKLLFIEEIQSDWHQCTVKKTHFHSSVYIPSAPFSKDLVGLGLKLMLMHVVKEGFDGLSWGMVRFNKRGIRQAFPLFGVFMTRLSVSIC